MAHSLPEVGDIIADKYVVQGLLGRGGMGAVYVVEHRVTGKRLALKCLLPEHTEHADRVERFLREAQAAGRIQHRHVVDVFDVGQDGELLFIVMELLEGHPLSDLIRQDQLSLDDILVVLHRSMQGVAAAHAGGIIHRDLKPDNIFICEGPSGRLDDPRVLDFGISKFEEAHPLELTQTGVMMGTPHYMAFEQINSQRDLDQRVDIYAMGVIAYEALSGRLPYVAESVGALAIQMMSTGPSGLNMLRPDLPGGLSEIIMRAMAKERDERFPSMQAFIEALEPYVMPDGGASGLPAQSPREEPAHDHRVVTPISLSGLSQDPSAELHLPSEEDDYRKARRQPGSSTLLWVAVFGLAVIVAIGLFSHEAQDGTDQAEPPGAKAAASPKTVRSVAPAARRSPPERAPTPARSLPKASTIGEVPQGEGLTEPHAGGEPAKRPKARKRGAEAAPATPVSEPSDALVDMVPPAPPVPPTEVLEEPPAKATSPTSDDAPAEIPKTNSEAPSNVIDPDSIASDRLPTETAKRPAEPTNEKSAPTSEEPATDGSEAPESAD